MCKNADLFQLWNALTRLDAFVKESHYDVLKVLQWRAVMDALSISHYVHEKQRISARPKHVHMYRLGQ